ncbi:putative ribonuclease H-like domain-containing protein [Tanacetum coccineum]
MTSPIITFTSIIGTRTDKMRRREESVREKCKLSQSPSLKPGVGFTKPTMRSKTPPPRRKENSHPHSKTPQPRRDQVADFTNLETVVNVSPIPTSRIHSSHPSALILGDPTSAVQTRSKVNTSSGAHAFVSYVLADLPYGKKAIGIKWVYQNKKDKRGVVVRNKARPDIMFAVFAFILRFWVTQKSSQSKYSDYAGAYLGQETPLIGGFVDKNQRHHFIRDAYEKKLIQVLKIHTDDNVAVLRNQALMLAALISLLTTITLSTTMVVLDSCPKHNMVAYLEKSEGNTEFHEIIDFLKRSSIHHALTMGRDSLPNQAIFNAIQLMGYEGDLTMLTFNKALFSPQWRATFLRKVTPLFASMLVQPTEDEGAHSERPSEAQPTPFLLPLVKHLPTTIIPDSILETSGGNLGGHSSSDKSLSGNEGDMTLQSVYDLCLSLCAQVSDQAKEILHLKAQIKKLKKQATPVIKHHRAWLQSVSLKQRLARKRSLKKQRVHKESNAQDVRRTREIVDEDKEIDEKITLLLRCTDEQIEGTEEQIKSTNGQRKGTKDHTEEGSATQATQTPTSTIFGDDKIIAKVLLNMSQGKEVSRENEKGVELRIIENNGTDYWRVMKRWLGKCKKSRKARIEADILLVEKLQEQEREQFTIEERAKFLHASQLLLNRYFFDSTESEAIRNRPPTMNQILEGGEKSLMTYLKHRSDKDFISLGLPKDERLIKRMNEKGVDSSKGEVIKEENKSKAKEENKGEESTRKRKLVLDEEKEVDYEILDRKYPIKEWKTECLGTKPQVDKAENLEEINQNVVIRSNGQKRYFSTLMRVLSIFDRKDLNAVYQLVMDRYQDEIPEGFDRVLWGDTELLNGVAEKRNRTLIEAARTMLADFTLPTTFWAEAVSIACYIQNRVLVVKPHNKTPYKLFRGLKLALNFMRPFGCHVTILNTLDNLGKFDGKSDEGFFVGYYLSSKAFRVYNTRTRRVEENLHIGFLENKPMIERNGPKWMFDIDSLTQSMNYVPVAAGTITNEFAGIQGELSAATSTQKA